LECDNNPRVGAQDEHDWRPIKVLKSKHVVVVGTGVAGLEAAYTAAKHGHKVTVLGDHERFGGKTKLHAELPGGENLSSVYDYQFTMARRLGVDFGLGRHASTDDVAALEPDIVLLATGARAMLPAWIDPDWAETGLIPSIRELAPQLLARSDSTPGRAVLVDQDHTEMTYAVAELLARRFEKVTIVTSRERIAHDVSLINRQGIYQRLHDLCVELLLNHEVKDLHALESGQLTCVNVYNGAITYLDDVAVITHASSRIPRDELYEPLVEKGFDVRLIGDSRAPRSLLATTREAYLVACAL
jgi:NADPH-dependent glutamate synthase beta subunit-like oxidoreductase